MTIARIDNLGSRANAESDWTRANQLRDQRDSLLVGILRQGITGEVPPGASVGFKPSDSDPNHSIWVMVGAQDLKRSYHLKDKRAGRTPAQQDIVDKARKIIRSGG